MKPLESLLPQIRPDVTDALDTTTQLETLGYNRQRVQKDFQLNNTFELGQRLFKILPKRGFFPTLQPLPWPWRAYLLTGAGFLLSLDTSWETWINLMTLFVWSFVFHAVLDRARATSKKTQQRLFSLAMLTGLGLILAGYLLLPSEPASIARLLFWWLFSLQLWHQPGLSWHLAVVLLSGGLSFIYPPASIILSLALSLLFRQSLAWPKSSTWHYLQPQGRLSALYLLYAAAQVLLISHLVYSAATPWLGLGILTATILMSAWLERRLATIMRRLLWSSKTREDYQAQLFSSLSVWVQVFLVMGFIVSLAFLRLLNIADYSLIHFALLGLATGLSLFLFRLKAHIAATLGFILAAALTFMGLPFWVVMLGLVSFFLTGMMLFIMRVERSSLTIL